MKIVRAILFILNIIAVIGLVLTTLAGIVAPSKNILLSLAAFGFVPMLLINVTFVILWLLMGRWEFLLSTAAIATRFTFVGLFFQIGGIKDFPPAEEHPAMVTMMSYNVHQFQGNTENITAAPNDTIAIDFLNLVKEYKPDVLCLQEYAAVRGINITDSLALMGYSHYYGTNNTPANIPYGSVIFSRKPITYVRRLDGEKLMAELMCDGRSMRVVCVHMDSYRFDTTDRRDIERIVHGDIELEDRTMLSKIKETIICHEKEWNEQIAPMLAESQTPTVVAGDLNDIPSSWLYHQMTRTLTDTYIKKGLGFCTTFCGKAMPAYRIDVIMHSSGLRTLSHHRIKTPISDHYPVLAAIEFEI